MAKSGAERTANWRARLRQLGLCPNCGKCAPASARSVCAACTNHVTRNTTQRRKRETERAKSYNLFFRHEQSADQAHEYHLYDAAVTYLEKALQLPFIDDADRARILEKLASDSFFIGDSSRREEALNDTLLERAKGSSSKETVNRLIELSANCWLACDTKSGLRPLLEAAQLCSRKKDSQLLTCVTIEMAHRYAELGYYTELGKALEKIAAQVCEPADTGPHLALVAKFAASQGREREAFRYFKNAIHKQASAGHGYTLMAIWSNYGVWARSFGKLEVAKECAEQALLVALRQGNWWPVPHQMLRYADILSSMGRYEVAYEYVKQALNRPMQTPRIKALLAYVAIPLALYFSDTTMLRVCSSSECIDAAFASGEEPLIGRVCAAFSMLWRFEGQSEKAIQLLSKALDVIHSGTLCWDLSLECARLSPATDAARGRLLLERRAKSPNSAVATACLMLFDAIVASRSGRLNSCRATALKASELFAQLAMKKYSDYADQVAGPRPTLSARAEQVARLASKGLTNRAIASELNISENTVETHMASVMQRWGIRSRHQIARFLEDPKPTLNATDG